MCSVATSFYTFLLLYVTRTLCDNYWVSVGLLEAHCDRDSDDRVSCVDLVAVTRGVRCLGS